MRWWHNHWSQLRDLARRARLDREIDDELRFHIEKNWRPAFDPG